MKKLTKEQINELIDGYRIGENLIQRHKHGEFFTPAYFFEREYACFLAEVEEGCFEGMSNSFEDFDKWVDDELVNYDFVSGLKAEKEKKRIRGAEKITLDDKPF
ncbi:hypothetical protein [Xylocopilactobacillus apis]|uniref:Uncharacterized protein n=1 Tax=Xylocopilactobacillus apis TaxID=2932183 RepID=A0AAU9DAY3_9LACO|nr:hypothetical protein [Xylocopilactobacillus apis]BDR56865.1 hypothetical protein KIMC2_14270 [Xylocopilactobacillus apis]